MSTWTLQQKLSTAQKLWTSQVSRSEAISLYYPADGWQADHAPEMLRILEETTATLTEGLHLRRPKDLICLATDSDWAVETLGVIGLALVDTVIVSCRPRCLSEFAGTAAHEVAHVLSRGIGPGENPFKCEGFACYAAEVMDAATRPCGMPLHYHLKWMDSVELAPTLVELWERRDYSPELYDLGWSFATFAVESFGLQRYYEFYRATDRDLDRRIAAVFGTPRSALERHWMSVVRESVPVDGRAISRMRRGSGSACSRAAWLAGR